MILLLILSIKTKLGMEEEYTRLLNYNILLMFIVVVTTTTIILLLITYHRHKYELLEQQYNLDTYRKENEKYKSEHDEKRVQLQVSQLMETSIYQSFLNPTFKPTAEDFVSLGKEIDKAYNGFCHRLRKIYSQINDKELHVCCLVKIGLRPKEICTYMDCRQNTLNMKKKRLYKKILAKGGTASDFDKFICDF